MASHAGRRPAPSNAAGQGRQAQPAAQAAAGAAPGPLRQLKQLADDSPQALQLQGCARMMAAKVAGQAYAIQRQAAGRAAGLQAGQGVVQRVVYANDGAMWAAVAPASTYANIMAVVNGNAELATLYQDVIAHLGMMNFVVAGGAQPNAAVGQNANGQYDITYDIPANQAGRFQQEEFFVGAMIHEMAHVASSQLYDTQIPEGSTYHIANMHLPALNGPTFQGTQVGMNQLQDQGTGANDQEDTMINNWTVLDNILMGSPDFSVTERQILQGRVQYGQGATPHAHYDTVLLDILFYLQHQNMTETHFYLHATAMLQEANVRRAAGQGQVANVAAVAAPAQDTATVHLAVQQLLNDGRWSQKGEALIGHKTPDGIRNLRNLLQNIPNQREALVAVRNAPAASAQTVSPRREAVTQQAYNALSADYRAGGVNATVLAINAVAAAL